MRHRRSVGAYGRCRPCRRNRRTLAGCRERVGALLFTDAGQFDPVVAHRASIDDGAVRRARNDHEEGQLAPGLPHLEHRDFLTLRRHHPGHAVGLAPEPQRRRARSRRIRRRLLGAPASFQFGSRSGRRWRDGLRRWCEPRRRYCRHWRRRRCAGGDLRRRRRSWRGCRGWWRRARDDLRRRSGWRRWGCRGSGQCRRDRGRLTEQTRDIVALSPRNGRRRRRSLRPGRRRRGRRLGDLGRWRWSSRGSRRRGQTHSRRRRRGRCLRDLRLRRCGRLQAFRRRGNG